MMEEGKMGFYLRRLPEIKRMMVSILFTDTDHPRFAQKEYCLVLMCFCVRGRSSCIWAPSFRASDRTS